MKILITGYPGTGKSSVAKELRRRGYKAYDTESMRGYMHAEDAHSGTRVLLPDPVPRGWFETSGGYNWDSIKILKLLGSPGDTFICSLADTQDQFYDTFDRIFLLVLDEAEMEQRLRQRQTTNYGKDPGELADILLNHRHFERSLIELGAVPINTKHAIHEIVDEIVSYAIISDNQ